MLMKCFLVIIKKSDLVFQTVICAFLLIYLCVFIHNVNFILPDMFVERHAIGFFIKLCL